MHFQQQMIVVVHQDIIEQMSGASRKIFLRLSRKMALSRSFSKCTTGCVLDG
jgi:hypothetical protein